jgi:hypothetical protein
VLTKTVSLCERNSVVAADAFCPQGKAPFQNTRSVFCPKKLPAKNEFSRFLSHKKFRAKKRVDPFSEKYNTSRQKRVDPFSVKKIRAKNELIAYRKHWLQKPSLPRSFDIRVTR